LLARLGRGEPANEALAESFEKLETLQGKFTAFAQAQAEAYGPGVDWTRPDELAVDPFQAEDPLKAHPRNYWVRHAHTLKLLEEKRWEDAVRSAEILIGLFPSYMGEDNGYELLARAWAGLGDDEGEAAALRLWTQHSATASAACLRLLELDLKAKNWNGVRDTAPRQLAINPLIKPTHYALGCAAQEIGDPAMAIDSFEKLLLLKPENPAEIHYRLGRLLSGSDPKKARHHVIEALLEAPRYGEAHELLGELKGKKP
jgi:tetratricopeptide (TPR) repeat protein